MTCYPQNQLSSAPFGRSWEDPTWLVPGTSSRPRDHFLPILSGPDEGFELGSPHRRLGILREEVAGYMPPKGPQDKTFKFQLQPTANRTEVDKRLAYLQQRGWLDERTTQVGVKALVFNNEPTTARLALLDVTIFQSRGGGFLAELRTETMPLRTFGAAATTVFDGLFALVLLASTLVLAMDMLLTVKHHYLDEVHLVGQRARRANTVLFDADTMEKVDLRQRLQWVLAGLLRCVTWVNLITGVTCLMGWANVGLLFLQASRGSEVRKRLESVLAAPLDTAAAHNLRVAADVMAGGASLCRVVVAYTHIAFVGRSFLAIQFQPRLGILIDTLKAVWQDLFPFVVVMVPTFLGFAIAATQIFGRRLSYFSTLQASVGTCFKIALEGEFDWAALSQEDFWLSMGWVFLYIVLIVLVLMNTVLAIIVDVYSVVRRDAGEVETVYENVLFYVKRVSHAKEWVPDRQLLEHVCDLPETFTVRELRKAVPELGETQLDLLVNGCHTKAAALVAGSIDSMHSTQFAAAMMLASEDTSRELSKMDEAGFLCNGVVPGDRQSRDEVVNILRGAAVQRQWGQTLVSRTREVKQRVLAQRPADREEGAAEEVEDTGPEELNT